MLRRLSKALVSNVAATITINYFRRWHIQLVFVVKGLDARSTFKDINQNV